MCIALLVDLALIPDQDEELEFQGIKYDPESKRMMELRRFQQLMEAVQKVQIDDPVAKITEGVKRKHCLLTKSHFIPRKVGFPMLDLLTNNIHINSCIWLQLYARVYGGKIAAALLYVCVIDIMEFVYLKDECPY
jgi:hypothetical protein